MHLAIRTELFPSVANLYEVELANPLHFRAGSRAIFDTSARTLEAARQDLIAQCVQILYVYRRFCASNPAPGQLILPETLKLLPLYTLGLLKNKVRLL